MNITPFNIDQVSGNNLQSVTGLVPDEVEADFVSSDSQETPPLQAVSNIAMKGINLEPPFAAEYETLEEAEEEERHQLDFLTPPWRSVIDPRFVEFIKGNNSALPYSSVVEMEKEEPVNLISHFHPVMLEKPASIVNMEFTVLGDIDTEFGKDTLNPDPDRHNFLFSLQFAGWVREGGDWRYTEGFRFVDGERLTLAGLLGWVLDVCQIPRNATPNVLLAAHFTTAEWSMLADRDKYKAHMSAIGRTVVTMRPLTVKAVRAHRNQTEVMLTLRDTLLLTPGRGGLQKASQMTHVKKIRLAKRYKSDMLSLLYERPGLFYAYAMNDVRAGLEYITIIGNKVPKLAGIDRLPLTLGGMSSAGFANWLESPQGYGYNTYCGNQPSTRLNKFNKPKIVYSPSLNRKLTDTIATPCFHGGRNYAMRYGVAKLPSHQMVVDKDLAGAYSGAMGVLPVVDFTIPPKQIRTISSLRTFHTAHTNQAYMPIAMGEVEFTFPANVEPCLPVATDAGLIYPLSGISYCCLPEVMQALDRGAQITLKAFYYWEPLRDAAGNVVFAFADYLRTLAQLRDTYPKGSPENALLKEAINSLYGKLAQGIKSSKVRDLLGIYTPLPPSRVTNVVYAAMVTSLVRATLCALEDSMTSAGGTILAATTDGAMCVFDVGNNAGFSQQAMPDFQKLLPAFYAEHPKHESIRLIQQGRVNLGQDPTKWLEPKHIGDAYLVFRTRGYFLMLYGKATFVAKGGHKIDGETNDEIAAEMLQYFQDDEPDEIEFKRLVSVFNIADGKVDDLVNTDEVRKVNFDWDWKRFLRSDGSSIPFADVNTMFRYRQAAQEIREMGRRATRDAVLLRVAGIKLQGSVAATIKRILLRVISQNLGGWAYPTSLTLRQLAGALGVPLQDVKNARLRTVSPQCLPRGDQFESVAQELCSLLGIPLTNFMRDYICIPE